MSGSFVSAGLKYFKRAILMQVHMIRLRWKISQKYRKSAKTAKVIPLKLSGYAVYAHIMRTCTFFFLQLLVCVIVADSVFVIYEVVSHHVTL